MMDEETRHIVSILSDEYSNRIFQIAKSTIPLFYATEKGHVKLAGSSVFIKADNRHYLISAAHVLAENVSSTFTLMEYELIYLNGRHLSSVIPPGGNRVDDKIDLTVIQLDQQSIDMLLRWYLPVTQDYMFLKQLPDVKFQYFIFGYPITRTVRKWNTDQIHSTRQAYASSLTKRFDYERFGFHKENHLAIAFDGNGLSKEIAHLHLIPDLTGISGSGLWYLDKAGANYLAGIIIQRINQPGQKAIVPTKIDSVFIYINELLKQ